MSNKVMEIKNLKKYFHTAQGIVKAVDKVDFTLNKGETFGLVGESGSGKSTVAYTLLGVYNPTAGEIYFHDQQIGGKQRAKFIKSNIQMVFQDPGNSLNPKQTIEKILELPLKIHNVVPKNKRREKIVELLDLVQLPKNFINKYPMVLGEGEKQSIAIARALAVNPEVLVLDEPTSALDVSMQAKIIKLLKELQNNLDLSYLFITHDLSLMRNIANRVGIMYLGRICEIGKTENFFKNPLHPYTKMLLSSIPVVSEEEESLKPKKSISKGEIPSPVNLPSGCPFHPRCSEKMDICTKEMPKLKIFDNGQKVYCHKYL